MTEPMRRRLRIPQLRVVFDTNALYTENEDRLVRLAVANLINESKFPDLEIQWYLPEIVRNERHYQMRKRALLLVPHIEKVERLLGHNLAITSESLLSGVEKVLAQRQQELDLLSLALDYNKVDWASVALDAAFRRPPFEEGDKEKGFRDRLIAESFLQLVANSPRTAASCRIVLLSNDKLLTETVEARTSEFTNVRVLASLEDLKELINTLVSEVSEELLAVIRPKAAKLFLVPDDKSTLFYTGHVREKLEAKFAKELAYLPPGATSRTNGTWRIGEPNFVKKTGKRVEWTSTIGVDAEASTNHHPETIGQPINVGSLVQPIAASEMVVPLFGTALASEDYLPFNVLSRTNWNPQKVSLVSTYSVKSHRGIDVYEVLWSADWTTKRELRRPSIDDIKHVESSWEQLT